MAEEKFSDELDIQKLLVKLRDSYDLTRNMVKKDYRGLLAYQRGRVIDPEKGSDSSPDVSSDEIPPEFKEDDKTKVITFNDHVKLSVVRGIQVESAVKSQLKDKIKTKVKANDMIQKIKDQTLENVQKRLEEVIQQKG